jgi:hypothetical protein
MIRVKRPTPPDELVLDGSVGVVETTKAIALFEIEANANEPFSFAAYKRESVKLALNKAFFFKCAYCESPVKATQPIDVEHFRPKGGVEIGGALQKPGYYWLAASWGNLLPSCTDCNRRRRQALPDGTELSIGKANAFPIADEAARARRKGEEKGEGRLLLHPFLDRPSSHLRFIPEGIVQGKTRKGRESIAVYALLRIGLVGAPAEHQAEIHVHLTILRGLVRELDLRGPSPGLEELVALELRKLNDFMAPPSPYSEMSRQMIEPVLDELMA